MKFNIRKTDLLNVAQAIQGVVSSKNTLPILSNMLIETQGKRLRLAATDLDTAMACTIDADVIHEGSTTVPAKRFTDIIKELPNENITISVKKNNVATIDCQNAYFKVNTIPKEEFPKLPNYKNQEYITIDQQKLKEMLAMTTFAISHDETRYVLNGVLFEIKPKRINLVATDGRRLAYTQRDIETKLQKPKKMIVPTKAVNELQRALRTGETKVYFGQNQVTFDMGSTVVISRLIEGDFPRYEQVIPKEHKEKLMVDRSAFLAATRRANLLTNQDSQAIKLDVFKNRLVVSKNTPDVGEAREELLTEYKGPNFSIGFNPNYLIDVLKNVNTETINFEVNAPDKPGVIRSQDNFVYVVLPMQLG